MRTLVTRAIVLELTTRVMAFIRRYRIYEPSRVVNLDEIGFGFAKMAARSLRRGVASASQTTTMIILAMRTHGNLNHVEMMVFVAADGTVFKPVAFFPVRQPHFRQMADGRFQTVHNFLPAFNLHHRNPADVESSIFLDWARHFLETS